MDVDLAEEVEEGVNVVVTSSAAGEAMTEAVEASGDRRARKVFMVRCSF